MMMIMMMMSFDLMCTKKLARGQVGLAHSTKVTNEMLEKTKNSWSPFQQGWKKPSF